MQGTASFMTAEPSRQLYQLYKSFRITYLFPINHTDVFQWMHYCFDYIAVLFLLGQGRIVFLFLSVILFLHPPKKCLNFTKQTVHTLHEEKHQRIMHRPLWVTNKICLYWLRIGWPKKRNAKSKDGGYCGEVHLDIIRFRSFGEKDKWRAEWICFYCQVQKGLACFPFSFKVNI